MTGISAIAGAAVSATVPTPPTSAASTTATGLVPDVGSGFGTAVVNALEQLQQAQGNADGLAVKAATGDLQDAHEFLIASTQASLATEMAVAVRNRAVEAFTSVMQMSV